MIKVRTIRENAGRCFLAALMGLGLSARADMADHYRDAATAAGAYRPGSVPNSPAAAQAMRLQQQINQAASQQFRQTSTRAVQGDGAYRGVTAAPQRTAAHSTRATAQSSARSIPNDVLTDLSAAIREGDAIDNADRQVDFSRNNNSDDDGMTQLLDELARTDERSPAGRANRVEAVQSMPIGQPAAGVRSPLAPPPNPGYVGLMNVQPPAPVPGTPSAGAQNAANRLLAATVGRSNTAPYRGGAQENFRTGFFVRTSVSPRLLAYMSVNHGIQRGSTEESPVRNDQSQQPHVASAQWRNLDGNEVRFAGRGHAETIGKDDPQPTSSYTNTIPGDVVRNPMPGAFDQTSNFFSGGSQYHPVPQPQTGGTRLILIGSPGLR